MRAFRRAAVAALLALGVGEAAFAQSPSPEVLVAEGIVAVPPPRWSVVQTASSNPWIEMVSSRPAFDAEGRPGVMTEAHATITVEPRSNHGEAVRRLAEIAAEVGSPPRYLVIAGWPALQRRHHAPLARRGPAKGGKDAASPTAGLSLHTTTAIAAGTRLVRVEGVVTPGKPDELATQIERMARDLRIHDKGDPAQAQREVRELEALPPPRPPVPAAPPGQGPEAPEPALAEADAVQTGRLAQPGLGEIEIAVSADGRNVVLASNQGYSKSLNGGRTFTSHDPLAVGFGQRGDPSLAWGPSGNFYYAFLGDPKGNPPAAGDGCTASVAVSSDRGQTFQWISHAAFCPRRGSALCFPDQEHIAADRAQRAPGDQLYVVWRNFTLAGTASRCDQFDFGSINPRISCSRDGGSTWPLQSALDLSGDFAKVTVGGDGFVYVVYVLNSNVMVDKFSSCATGLVRQTGFPVTVTSGIDGVECPVPGLDRCDRRMLASPMVAVDESDPAHVFVAYATKTVVGNEDVIVRDSLDGGLTWTGTAQVSAAVTGRRFMPWVCAAQGTAHVSWYDRRAGVASATDLTGYFYGSVRREGGSLVSLGDQDISQANDPQCASGWPCGTRDPGDSDRCPSQPQLAGFCSVSPVRCDFDQPRCPTGETCLLSSGCPKYGDYNGNACAAGHFYAAWASATPPPGTVAPPGINVYSTVIPPPEPVAHHWADYCRRVGDENLESSFISCTPSLTQGFGTTYMSRLIDWGQNAGAAWVDFDDDGLTDYCRRVGDQNLVSSFLSCTVSTGTGFGTTFTSGVVDWGYDAGAAWVDFNADGMADYCRRVGDENLVSSFVSCTVSTGTGFGPTYISGVVDWGYDAGAAWVDFNADGMADYCRRVGDENLVSSFVSCTVSTGTGFGPTYISGVLDWGYDEGVAWTDFTGDKQADYCRRVGDENLVSSFLSCTASTGTGFGATVISGLVDWGYDAGVAWTDFNRDQKSDYCRRIGDENLVSSFVSCTTSTGTGFGPTYVSGVVDWGYDAGVGWVDFNGDEMSDYCRRIGDENFVSSFVSCTLSTGTGFGPTHASGLLDWGYDEGVAWTDSVLP